jgi:hypothetical protein
MESKKITKEQEQIQTLFQELNIKETNMPEVPKLETRIQR